MHQRYDLASNPQGFWEIRWTERNEDGRARSQRHSTRTRDYSAAQSYLTRWAHARGEALATLTTPSLNDLIDFYLEGCVERGVRPSQRYNVEAIRKALGGFTVADLRTGAVDAYCRARRSQASQRSRSAKPVSAGTLRRELGCLVSVLRWAVKKGRIDKAEDLPQIEMPSHVHTERQFLNEEAEAEFYRLAQAWSVRSVRLYVAIGFDTGARKEAIEELHWSQIDLKAGTIDFRKTGKRQTKKRRVPTPINDRLRGVLESVPESERWGRVVGNNNMRRPFSAFARSTPWPWVTSHIMRHTCITLNLRAGVTIWDVAQMVGDTPEVITEHYGHAQADWRLKEAANKRFKRAG